MASLNPQARARVAVIAVAAALPMAVLLAGNHVWTGAGVNGNWSNSTDWDPNGPPVPFEPTPVSLTFPQSAVQRNMVQDVPNLTVNAIVFDGLAYSVAGSGVSFGGSVSVGPGSITDDHTVLLPLSLVAPLSTIVTGPNAGVIFQGAISGPHGITTGGAGFTVLGGNNTYTGQTIVSSGTLIIQSPTALGTAAADTTVQNGASLLPINYVTDPNDPEVIHLQPGSFLKGQGVNTIYGIEIPGPAPATASLFPGVIVNVGSLTGPGMLGLTGGGTFHVLPGSSPFSGTITDTGGILQIDGSMPNGLVILNGSSAVLDGAGTTGPLTVIQGQVSPGTSPGILSVNGGVTFTGGGSSSLKVELNGTAPGTGYDRLAVTGSVGLGAAASLIVTVGYAPTPGDSFIIIQNDGADAVTGNFAGLAEGAMVTVGNRKFQITYAGGDGNDVALSFVGCVTDTNAPTVTPPGASNVTQTLCM